MQYFLKELHMFMSMWSTTKIWEWNKTWGAYDIMQNCQNNSSVLYSTVQVFIYSKLFSNSTKHILYPFGFVLFKIWNVTFDTHWVNNINTVLKFNIYIKYLFIQIYVYVTLPTIFFHHISQKKLSIFSLNIYTTNEQLFSTMKIWTTVLLATAQK